MQVAEVDGLGLAVGNPKRVPHGIVAQVGDVRDASRDLPAAYDGAIGRGKAEEQAGIGLIADHQRAVTHPSDGLQPAIEGSYVNGREHLRFAVTRGAHSADLLLLTLKDEIDVAGRGIQGDTLAVQPKAVSLNIEGRGLSGKTHLVDTPSVGSGYEAASVGGEAKAGKTLDAGCGDAGVSAHHWQVIRFRITSRVLYLLVKVYAVFSTSSTDLKRTVLIKIEDFL